MEAIKTMKYQVTLNQKKKKLFVETPINVCLYRRLTGILPTKYFFFFFNYIFEITSNVRKSLYYLNKTFQGSNS